MGSKSISDKKEKGLNFHKIDLHVHTPASTCFPDKNITPENIVKAALSKGLSAIAITDHNTGACRGGGRWFKCNFSRDC